MKDAQKRILNGPRYRAQRINTLSKEWLDSIANSEECLIKDKSKLKEIIRTVNEEIARTVINTRDGIEFPEQLGYVFLGTCLPKVRKNVDFKTTDHYLKVIQHRNWESDNYLAKIFYTNYETKYKFKFNELWQFSGCREFTRAVGAEYPKNWKMYIQVDHTLKVSKLFRKYMRDRRIEKESIEILKNYNPLEL
jgi:hypothetical protein